MKVRRKALQADGAACSKAHRDIKRMVHFKNHKQFYIVGILLCRKEDADDKTGQVSSDQVMQISFTPAKQLALEL